MVNGGGNTPIGLEVKGGTELDLFYVLPSLPDDVDGRDFLVWQRNLGTAVSEAASEWVSHGPEPIQATVDVLGSAPQLFDYQII